MVFLRLLFKWLFKVVRSVVLLLLEGLSMVSILFGLIMFVIFFSMIYLFDFFVNDDDDDYVFFYLFFCNLILYNIFWNCKIFV